MLRYFWFSIPLLVAGLLHGELPTGVQCKTFYDTEAIRYTDPVWFGEVPGRKGSFLVGELGGGVFLLAPGSAGFGSTLFARFTPYYFAGNDGLLGMAFHPGFADNRRYYVYYNSKRGETVLEERTAAADFRTDAGTSRILMRISFQNVVHNGGDMHFGTDGFLYLALGDAGNPNVFNDRSQDLALLHGKMLRLDVDRKDAGLEYAIPADNPFAAASDPMVRREIYAYGLRQPWRWSFDPADGRIIVADVGDWVQEEINVIRKGGNYGWSRMEGYTCFNRDNELAPLNTCDTAGLIPPVSVLPHEPVSAAATSSITGGFVFRGDTASPSFGVYFFGDYVDRKLYGLRFGSDGREAELAQVGLAPSAMSSFGMDSDGNIYMVGLNSGIIYRLDHPDLQGKGLAILSEPGRGRGAFKGAPGTLVPRRSGEGWWVSPGMLPGINGFRIFGLDGKVLKAVSPEESRFGFQVTGPAGFYFAKGPSDSRNQAYSLLLK